MAKKKINSTNVLVGVVLTILLIYTLSIVLILFWGVLTSLKAPIDFKGLVTGKPNMIGFPDPKLSEEHLKLFNYKVIFDKFEMEKSEIFYNAFDSNPVEHYTKTNIVGLVINTILYAMLGSFLAAMVPCLMAYVCAKYDYFYSKVVYAIVLFTMVIPIIGNTPSMITVLRSLNLYDSWLGYIIQKFNFVGMYFLVFFGFFKSLSNTYEEAAEIDGAGQYRILFSIILPLTVKMISSVMLIQVVQHWNDYQTPMLYLPTHPTLAYSVYELAYGNSHRDLSNIPVRIAACMFLALPLLILFICFQKKLMGNVSIGGIKE